MNEKYFRNKYRIDSARRPGWDYSKSGFYFITIVTKERECLFGEIQGGIMILNDMGRIAQKCWGDIPLHFKNVVLDEYIIMPNHIHGILCLDNAVAVGSTVETLHCNVFTSKMRDVSTENTDNVFTNTTSNVAETNTMSDISPKKGSLSVILRSFKSAVTKYINISRGIKGLPVWHERFHDRIIRDEIELFHTQEYIKNNPRNWSEDELKNAA